MVMVVLSSSTYEISKYLCLILRFSGTHTFFDSPQNCRRIHPRKHDDDTVSTKKIINITRLSKKNMFKTRNFYLFTWTHPWARGLLILLPSSSVVGSMSPSPSPSASSVSILSPSSSFLPSSPSSFFASSFFSGSLGLGLGFVMTGRQDV